MMRRSLFRLAMGVAATAAALAMVAPAAHATGGGAVEDRRSASTPAPSPRSTLDGWGKQDLDVSFGSAMAAGVGDLLDRWAIRDVDIKAFGSAMTQSGPGSQLDGWANRGMHIDAFGSAMTQQFVPWAQAHDKFV